MNQVSMIRATLISAAAMMLALPAVAADVVKGAAKAKEVCAACHGDDGNGKKEFPDYPKLAGQHADYLAVALREYKSGVRKNAIMGAQAQQLSADDIRNIAAFYARQPTTLKVMR